MSTRNTVWIMLFTSGVCPERFEKIDETGA